MLNKCNIKLFFVLQFILFFIIPTKAYCQLPYFETKLPIIIIDTQGSTIVDEPKISANMGIIYQDGYINKVTDPVNNFDGKIRIEIRGVSSQQFPKKSYAFETCDSIGNDKAVSLIGLPKEEDWILYASYDDKTLIRNALAQKLSRNLGHYASRTRFCEVVVNNDYLGVYILMEKIKVDKSRLDIKKITADDLSGDNLTGGYIFKFDRIAGDNTEGWYSLYPPLYGNPSAGLFYQYHYPNQNKITYEQKQYLKDWVNGFENIFSKSYRYNAQIGYRNLLDVESAVDYFLINEVAKNYDMCSASFYMHKDIDSRDTKLHLGPIWDFDLSMGNSYDEITRSPQGWRMDVFFHPWGQSLMRPFWTKTIWDDPAFKKAFSDGWNSKKGNLLSYSYINTLIDSFVVEIEGSIDRNFERWPILGVKVWPMTDYDHDLYLFNTYEEEIDYLKDWIKNRIIWIDSEINSWDLPPDKPTNLHASPYQGYVILDWNQTTDTDIAYYNIYRNVYANFNPMGPTERIGVSNSNNYHDEGNSLAINTIYYYKVSTVDSAGYESDYSDEISLTTLNIEDNEIVKGFKLEQNYPNPFNPSTSIKFRIAENTIVKLQIFDINGTLIKTIYNEYLIIGSQITNWSGTNQQGSPVPAGIYFYQLRAGDFVQTKKMVLMK